MDKEHALLSSCSLIAGHEIVSSVAGIGKVNAALTASSLIERCRPDCIVNTGVAGGLGADVHMGDLVVASSCAYHDVWCGDGNEPGQVQGLPARFFSDSRLLDAARGAEMNAKVHFGLICTGDRFIETLEEDRRILEVFPDALACDMESAAIAQVCFLKGVPFISFRIVSDCYADGGHLESYGDFWNTVSDRSFESVQTLIKSFPSSI